MSRLLQPFVLVVTAVLGAGYAYLALRLTAGQFFPWTLAIHLVHAPHVAGLSRQGRMWVYVSAGTGTWGPPVRIGTEPELTLIRLVRIAAPPPQVYATVSVE